MKRPYAHNRLRPSGLNNGYIRLPIKELPLDSYFLVEYKKDHAPLAVHKDKDGKFWRVCDGSEVTKYVTPETEVKMVQREHALRHAYITRRGGVE